MSVENDIETIEHLDFDHEPDCDTPTCSTRAVWRRTFVCCSAAFLVCNPHELDDRNFVKSHPTHCMTCDTIFAIGEQGWESVRL